MVQNNLPPESQPWVRAIETEQKSTRSRINTILTDYGVQQQNVVSGLSAIPDRIAALEAAQEILPVQIASTYITYAPKLETVAANTWIPEVQMTPILAPFSRNTNVSLMVVSTFFMRRSAGFSLDDMRITINGTVYPKQAIGYDSTGVSVAAAALTGVSQVNVGVDFYTSTPGTILNSPGFPNHVRSFIVAVWS